MPDTDLNHEFEQRAQRIAERADRYAKPIGQVAFEIEEALHEAYLAGVKSAPAALSAVGSSSLQECTCGSKRPGYARENDPHFPWCALAPKTSSLHEGEQEPQPAFRPHDYLDDGTGTACVRCGGREADLCHTSASSSAAPSLRELRELEQKWRDAARLIRESAYKETLRGFATEREDCADQLAALLSGKGK